MDPSCLLLHPFMAIIVISPKQRYIIAIIWIALTLYARYLYVTVPTTPSRSPSKHVLRDDELPTRVRRSEKIYDTVLEKRKELIHKYGPTPNDIELFPQNQAPWPPFTVWDFFPASFSCPHEVQRLGALGDGGKFVCGLSRLVEKHDCVVYSFGINGESSFERDILEKTDHCEIWGYDFSVRSFGPQISRGLAHRTHFKAYGIAGSDMDGPNRKFKMYTLETLMKQNGHEFIDILKVDIEMWEYETLAALIKPYIDSGKPLPFGQMQLEVHIWNRNFKEFLTWWEMLEEGGLRPFWTEPNLVYQNFNNVYHRPNLAEYSFINIKGDNILIKDP